MSETINNGKKKGSTGRKNRINLEIQWPTKPFWTFEELWDFGTNKKFVDITLRVKFINKYVKTGKFQIIGYLKGDTGRPKNVYARNPTSADVVKMAEASGVNVMFTNPNISHSPTPSNMFGNSKSMDSIVK